MTTLKYLTALFLCLAGLFTACTGNAPLTDPDSLLSEELSHPGISSIVEDGFGHIWIGTHYGLNKNLEYAYRQYYSSEDSLHLHDNHISSLLVDDEGTLWVETIGSGTYRYTRDGNFKLVPKDFHGISRPKLLLGADRSVLCNTEWGIFRYDREQGVMTCVIREEEQNRSCFVAGDRLYIVYPEKISIYDGQAYTKIATVPLPGRGYSVVPGPENAIWLTGNARPLAMDLGTFVTSPLPESVSDAIGDRRIINALPLRGDANAWLMSENSSLLLYDVASRTMTRVPDDLTGENTYLITSLFQDSRNNVWVGTNGGGAMILPDWRSHSDLTSLKEKLRGKYIVSLRYDRPLRVLHVSDNNDGLYSYDFTTSTLVSGTQASLPRKGGQMPFLQQKRQEQVLRSGNTVSVRYDSDLEEKDATGRVVRSIPLDTLRAVLACRHLVPEALFEDSEGKIWLGTQSKGIAIADLRSGRVFKAGRGSSDEISCIGEDRDHHVWVGTLFGLNRYNMDGSVADIFTAGNGISCNAISGTPPCCLDDGSMVFGTMQGIEIMSPSTRDIDIDPFPVLFEDLKIENTSVKPGAGSPIDKDLVYRPEVKLRYNQNNFTVAFTILDYRGQSRPRYQYRLDGFNDYWIDARSSNEAVFSHIPSGHYTLEVRNTNAGGDKVYGTGSLEISIGKAPWATWWARLGYFLLLALGVAFVVLRARKRAENFERIRVAEMEKEQEQHINEINKRYFANVAHQLRTPLTMISGPIEMLQRSRNIDSGEKRMFSIVKHNVGRMLTMVNQILDFNQLETDALSLKVRLCDISAVLRSTLAIFKLNADEKDITLETENVGDNTYIYADAEKVENIVDNLLSNAVKFTPQGGRIDVSLKREERPEGPFACITVRDTGPGIPEDQLEKIFERYHQVDGSYKGVMNPGSGIGLYYSRKLAELHHGSLYASNASDPAGTIFTLRIPIDRSAYTEAEINAGYEDKTVAAAARRNVDLPVLPEDPTRNPIRPTILVVDDDPDVTYYLRTLLEPAYNVTCRYDVPSAEKSMADSMPNLVISDLVMKGQTGFDLCAFIKGELTYCHIPVILLTAKDGIEDQIQGLNAGADAYVTKPFNPEYLLTLVSNQLRRWETLKKRLTEGAGLEVAADQSLSAQDRKFLKDLYALMEEELGNSELNISGIVDKLYMSHSKFIYKVKGLTGTTPLEFFKNYKLNRAAAMLKEGKYNVTEVADMTGFSSQSHFSKVFKKKFGISPSEYR